MHCGAFGGARADTVRCISGDYELHQTSVGEARRGLTLPDTAGALGMSEPVAEPETAWGSWFRRDGLRGAMGFALALMALRLWAAAYTDLNPDEAYYWYW